MDDTWHELLRAGDGYRRQPAASPRELAHVEATLNAALPADLTALYAVSNGVFDEPGQWFVIWTLADLVTRNQESWAREGVGRERLVGFGDDGTGNPFCVPRGGGRGVFHWSPIDGAATRLADTVVDFWSGWTSGAITT